MLRGAKQRPGGGGGRRSLRRSRGALPPRLLHSLAPPAASWQAEEGDSLSPTSWARQVMLATRLAHHWRGSLAVIFTLIFFTFFTGGINVRIYAPTIFTLAGMGRARRAAMTVGLGVVKVFSTGCAVWRIDAVGRRFFVRAGVGPHRTAHVAVDGGPVEVEHGDAGAHRALLA